MRVRINWRDTLAALLITATLVVFPFANPCQTKDGALCTWDASESGNGNGRSFTDYYGITIYHP